MMLSSPVVLEDGEMRQIIIITTTTTTTTIGSSTFECILL
jgi:hypothetical protein